MPINGYIGITNDELDDITNLVLDYLKDNKETLDYKLNIKGNNREVFNDTEKYHMVDVKNLYLNAMNVRNILFIISIICLILIIYFDKKKAFKYLYQSFRNVLFFILIIVSALALMIIIDFNSFWNTFHHIFFSNDLWLLDLRTDVLIMIVPPDFFNALCIRIVIYTIISFLVLYLLFLFLKRKYSYD